MILGFSLLFLATGPGKIESVMGILRITFKIAYRLCLNLRYYVHKDQIKQFASGISRNEHEENAARELPVR